MLSEVRGTPCRRCALAVLVGLSAMLPACGRGASGEIAPPLVVESNTRTLLPAAVIPQPEPPQPDAPGFDARLGGGHERAPRSSGGGVEEPVRIRVRRGESEGHYAQALGLSSAELRRRLEMRSRHLIAGEEITIRMTPEEQDRFQLSRRVQRVSKAQDCLDRYEIKRVEHFLARPGDTLESIIRRRGSERCLVEIFNPYSDLGRLSDSEGLLLPIVHDPPRSEGGR